MELPFWRCASPWAAEETPEVEGGGGGTQEWATATRRGLFPAACLMAPWKDPASVHFTGEFLSILGPQPERCSSQAF